MGYVKCNRSECNNETFNINNFNFSIFNYITLIIPCGKESFKKNRVECGVQIMSYYLDKEERLTCRGYIYRCGLIN